MEILVGYLVLLVLTKSVKFIYKVDVLEELAVRGYKLENYDEFNKSTIKDLIPFGNLFAAIKNLRKFKTNREEQMAEVMRFENIVKMTYDEKYNFYTSDDSAAIKAWLINREENVHSNNIIATHTIKADEDNFLLYQVDLGLESGYKIITTSGSSFKSLTEDEQIDLINEYYSFVQRELKLYVAKKYGGHEERFQEDISNGDVDYTSVQAKIDKKYERKLANKMLK